MNDIVATNAIDHFVVQCVYASQCLRSQSKRFTRLLYAVALYALYMCNAQPYMVYAIPTTFR